MQGLIKRRAGRVLVVGNKPASRDLAAEIGNTFGSRVATLSSTHVDALQAARYSSPSIAIVEGPFNFAASGWAVAAALAFVMRPHVPQLIALATTRSCTYLANASHLFDRIADHTSLLPVMSTLLDRRRSAVIPKRWQRVDDKPDYRPASRG